MHPKDRHPEVVEYDFDEHPVRVRLQLPDQEGVVFDVWFGDDGSANAVGYAVRLTEGATTPIGARNGLRAPYGVLVAHAYEFLVHNVGFEILGNAPPLATRVTKRPGRKKRPLRDYAEIAQAYVDALESAPQRPVEAAAEKLGISRKSMSNALTQARERGLLTRPRKQGYGGGKLTKKAKDILSGGDDGAC